MIVILLILSQLNYARSWVPTLAMDNLPIKDKNIKKHLIWIMYYTMLSMDYPDALVEWANENIPTLNTPKCFFVPAIETLRYKYKIKFKDDKNEES